MTAISVMAHGWRQRVRSRGRCLANLTLLTSLTLLASLVTLGACQEDRCTSEPGSVEIRFSLAGFSGDEPKSIEHIEVFGELPAGSQEKHKSLSRQESGLSGNQGLFYISFTATELSKATSMKLRLEAVDKTKKILGVSSTKIFGVKPKSCNPQDFTIKKG
ncbi:MAG: hypothetical protein KAI47_14780, partial [Deltaproteobacteria bacterium]|nr:hypothetical protein [Deltaproteobacteria bacterium]